MKTPGELPCISVPDERLAVCRLDAASEIPSWTVSNDFTSFTRTKDELSVVCLEGAVPEGVACEKGWRILKLEGPLDFSLVGVLAGITGALAAAGISVFSISTYDTDYVLVKGDMLSTAILALRETGHDVREASTNVVVRVATTDDGPFLWEILYEAVHWNRQETSPKPPPEELLSEPGLRRYLEGWGRENDFAVVALNTWDGSRIGATWYRTFPVSDPGYGFVDEATPEIVLAVVSDRCGSGVGGTLLRSLMDAAHSNGLDALSLGVHKGNHAAIKLYEKNGFVRFKDDGRAWIMNADLSTAQTTNDA